MWREWSSQLFHHYSDRVESLLRSWCSSNAILHLAYTIPCNIFRWLSILWQFAISVLSHDLHDQLVPSTVNQTSSFHFPLTVLSWYSGIQFRISVTDLSHPCLLEEIRLLHRKPARVGWFVHLEERAVLAWHHLVNCLGCRRFCLTQYRSRMR